MILIGTFGYMMLEKWNFLDSIYMTIITLTTIGFQEVHPLSSAGRIFTLVFALIGFSILAGSISILSSAIIEWRVIERYRRKKMFDKIKKFKKHIIICGAGRIGKYVILEMLKSKKEFVVIDHEPSYIQQIIKELNLGEKDLYFIEGDATKEEILLQAGIMNAEGLISCLPEDSQNLFICLTAKSLKQNLKVTSFVIEEQNTSKFFLIGVDEVVSGNFIIGKRLALSMMNENILSFLEQVTYIEKQAYYLGNVDVKSHSSLIGKTLKDANIGHNVGLLIFAIKKAGETQYEFNPKSDHIVQTGDVMIALGSQHDLEKLENYINGS